MIARISGGPIEGDGMTAKLMFLEDKWDESVASEMDGPEMLRYRSNLLGSDLRITNFGGGNTSSKLDRSTQSTVN